MDKKFKKLGSVWFSSMDDRQIGIVAMNNGFEDKAYIGFGYGLSQSRDEEYILKNGTPFPINEALQMIGAKPAKKIFDVEQLKDITGADEVEVKIRNDSKVLWINTEKGCVLRICQIKHLSLVDERKDHG